MKRIQWLAFDPPDLGPGHAPLRETAWWRRVVERLGLASRWKEIGYLLARLPLGVLTFVVSTVVWSSGVAGG